MNIDEEKFDHLINNLERTSYLDSIFNFEFGSSAFLSIGKGNVYEWLDSLLPNTRLIIEPQIIGSCIGIQYINGKLNKAVNKNSIEITEKVHSLIAIPKTIPIKERIEIKGVLYEDANKSAEQKESKFRNIHKSSTVRIEPRFCAFQIFHCKINHYQALQELKNLNFEIPETQFTKFISDIEIYLKCWKEGKLFQSYPTRGIVLKINSRKLQKIIEEKNNTRHWSYAIN